MVWMTEGKRLVSPEGYLGTPPTCAPHAGRRRNPKGLLMPFPVMPVDSKTCPSYLQVSFGYDNSFYGETEGDVMQLQGGENCVLLPLAHTVTSETAVTGVADGCFLSPLGWALQNCHMRLLQLTVRDMESKNFQAYCRQTVQPALDFHCDRCHCCKMWRKV